MGIRIQTQGLLTQHSMFELRTLMGIFVIKAKCNTAWSLVFTVSCITHCLIQYSDPWWSCGGVYEFVICWRNVCLPFIRWVRVWQHNWLGCAYNQWTTFIYMPAGAIFHSVLFLSTPQSSCELEFNVPRIQDGHGWPICSEMSRMWRALKTELGNEVRHSSLAQSENPTVTMITVIVAYCSQVVAYSIVCVQYK